VTRPDGDTANQVLRMFDAKAATWPKKYAPDGRLVGRLTQLAGAIEYRAAPGGRVLDLGCGTGELARHIAASGRRTTGCDISAAMLDGAAGVDPVGDVDWVRLRPGWDVLPFQAETFDVVVASSVLEYVGEPSAVLRECARVLCRAGTLLMTVPDGRHPIRWLEWLCSGPARIPSVSAAARSSPRLHAYVTYLRISRQRHTCRWWRAAAAESGLRMIPSGPGQARPSPMRLFTFQHSAARPTAAARRPA
jgi:SAM-dependent methyltransferase